MASFVNDEKSAYADKNFVISKRQTHTNMPELPEIAHARKFADEALLHKEIVDIVYGAEKPLQHPKQTFTKALKGYKFVKTERLGKYLFIKNNADKWLVLHFGMSGSLDFSRMEDLAKHAIITFYFSDHTHFSFVCPRKFGKVWLAESVADFQAIHRLGPDALSLSEKEFLQIMQSQTAGAKSVLMDQHKISGIGNVYADEILYQTGVHPKTKISTLKDRELKKLYQHVNSILKEAIELIASEKETPKNWLKGHRKEGADCPNGNGKVKKTTVGGRTTYFCEALQHQK